MISLCVVLGFVSMVTWVVCVVLCWGLLRMLVWWIAVSLDRLVWRRDLRVWCEFSAVVVFGWYVLGVFVLIWDVLLFLLGLFRLASWFGSWVE